MRNNVVKWFIYLKMVCKDLLGSLGLISWSRKEENIIKGDEEVGNKENFEQNKEDYSQGMHERMITQCMVMVWEGKIYWEDIGLNGKELNVILWTMLGFSLQKVVWLYTTHKKQFLMINLGRTMLGFASCIVIWLYQQWWPFGNGHWFKQFLMGTP
jgi:hypothetical protein